MGMFNNYMKEGKGVQKDQRIPRLFLFFRIFFGKFWSFLVLNMLYLLFCIPIVTIGPATAAFTKILRNYAREEHAFLWGDFIETFKNNFKQGFFYSLIDFFVSSFLLLNLLLIPGLPNQLMTTMSLAVTLLTLTIWSFMRYYIYLMMITFRLTLKQLLKNAFIFCWAGFLRNLFITLIIAALVYFGYMYLGFFYMLFVVLVILFSLCGFLVIFTVYPLVKKHMMDGYDPETGDRIDDEGYEGFSDSNE